MLPRLYRALTWPLAPLATLYLAQRRRRGREHPIRFRERRGIPNETRPDGPLVWIHAASVGEAIAVLGLIEQLLETRSDLTVLVTTGTVTSARLLETRLPPRARHQFVPADLPRWTARFLDYWLPDLAIWVESELWPNLVFAAHARGIPMVLLNGRLSGRSYGRWRRAPGLIRPVLGCFELCLVQDRRQAERFRSLGAGRVDPVGDLKAAAPPLPFDPAELTRLRCSIGSRPLWLAASTHNNEESIAARAHHTLVQKHPGLLTIIVPRHPARADAIGAMLTGQGLCVARRANGDPVTPATQVYLADTMGELGVFYRLAGIVFVGGSLVAKGGHNPFEAARLDCAVLHGPNMANCAAMAAALAEVGGAETVDGVAALTEAVSALLADQRLRDERATAAARAAAAGLSILDVVVERLAPWLDRIAPARDIARSPRTVRA
jgi:3-deoxy-D-manno-octulosonic-acid transferase